MALFRKVSQIQTAIQYATIVFRGNLSTQMTFCIVDKLFVKKELGGKSKFFCFLFGGSGVLCGTFLFVIVQGSVQCVEQILLFVV